MDIGLRCRSRCVDPRGARVTVRPPHQPRSSRVSMAGSPKARRHASYAEDSPAETCAWYGAGAEAAKEFRRRRIRSAVEPSVQAYESQCIGFAWECVESRCYNAPNNIVIDLGASTPQKLSCSWIHVLQHQSIPELTRHTRIAEVLLNTKYCHYVVKRAPRNIQFDS